jgi:hypothetical protein
MTDNTSSTAQPPLDKLEAARRQLECAIRLVAAEDDELAIHTLVMAAYGILEDLSKGGPYYEIGVKPFLTEIGQKRFRATANFLKHADRDPRAVHTPEDLGMTDTRIGVCITLYRELKGTFTPAMAAFHNWMVVRHPDEFNIAEDEDKDVEELYRQGLTIIDRSTSLIMLNALLEVYKDGLIPPNIGFRRKPRTGPFGIGFRQE